MVNIHEAKTNLSSLIEQLEQKKDVVYICRSGKPVAQLVLIDKPPKKLKLNLKLKAKIMADPTLPLDEADWSMD